MVREISEPALPRPQRLLIQLATVAALALALAACGRKGALDPPPGGYVLEQQQGKTPVTRKGEERPRAIGPEDDDEGRPVVSRGPKKKLPADWLID
jgi:predicted small lipoprotein YifL